MKRLVVLSFILGICGSHTVQAQIDQSGLAWGLSVGGAHGTNAPGDIWVPHVRGYLQMRLMSSMLLGQVGVGYAQMHDPRVYSTKTGMVDARLLFSPFTLDNLNPFMYGGFGLSKSFIGSGNDYLAMIPFGLGLQTMISSGILLEISGHTDNVGSDASNQKLSLERAQAVRNWLVQKGIASNRMSAVGKGEMESVASNDSAAGRADNRRIEFYVP